MAMLVRVIVRVTVMVARQQRALPAVSTTLRLERPLYAVHVPPEPRDHIRQNVIRLNVDCPTSDLARRMPVPDVPGYARELESVMRVDLQQILRRGTDLDQPSVLQCQGIAMREVRGLRKIE